MARIAVIGAGAFGTALAIYSHSVGHDVRVWCFEQELPGLISDKGENEPYLPGNPIDPAIEFSNDIAAVVAGADLVLIMCPSSHVRNTSKAIAPYMPAGILIASAAKGIENGTLQLMSQVLAETLPAHIDSLAYLSGPSFAKDLAAGLPTNIACAANDYQVALQVQDLLHSPRLRVYTSDDAIGVELGGAVKNIIAIACGASDALGMGASAHASLMTRGLAEITRLGVALGADPITFLGLAGVGDLVLTCTCDLSRNRTFGKRLAGGETPDDILSSQRAVAEGYVTVKAVHALKQKMNVDMPITDAVYRVCYEGSAFREEAVNLSSRDKKDEFQGMRGR
jgi:glycerol-3-phosphate dehydrogenase (NAD(P)+)